MCTAVTGQDLHRLYLMSFEPQCSLIALYTIIVNVSKLTFPWPYPVMRDPLPLQNILSR